MMLNYHYTINMPCTIINFDSVAHSVLLFCTVRLLISTVIPPSARLKGPVQLFGTRVYMYLSLLVWNLSCYLICLAYSLPLLTILHLLLDWYFTKLSSTMDLLLLELYRKSLSIIIFLVLKKDFFKLKC